MVINTIGGMDGRHGWRLVIARWVRSERKIIKLTFEEEGGESWMSLTEQSKGVEYTVGLEKEEVI